MKKVLFISLLAVSCIISHAQNQFSVTVNATTTNYWVATIGNALLSPINNHGSDDEVLFSVGWNYKFPVSVANNAPDGFGEMRGGYARAFSTPWKRVGDYSIGVTGSWANVDTPVGAYAGVNYKSNEVVFKDDDRNDRTHYISPEMGLRFRLGEYRGLLIEVGAAYDAVLSYNGKYHDYSKDAVNSGICANMGIGLWGQSAAIVIRYSHPTYNYYNQDFTPDNGITFPFKGVNRKLGYISLGASLAL